MRLLNIPTPLLSTANKNKKNSYLYTGNEKKKKIKLHFSSPTWKKAHTCKCYIKALSLYLFSPTIVTHLTLSVANPTELHFTQWLQPFLSDCQAEDERWGQSRTVKLYWKVPGKLPWGWKLWVWSNIIPSLYARTTPAWGEWKTLAK